MHRNLFAEKLLNFDKAMARSIIICWFKQCNTTFIDKINNQFFNLWYSRYFRNNYFNHLCDVILWPRAQIRIIIKSLHLNELKSKYYCTVFRVDMSLYVFYMQPVLSLNFYCENQFSFNNVLSTRLLLIIINVHILLSGCYLYVRLYRVNFLLILYTYAGESMWKHIK